MEYKYPLKMQSVDSNLVVEFVNESSGIVIIAGKGWTVGNRAEAWIKHTDTSVWKPYIEPTEEKPFQLEVGKTYVTRDGKGKGTVLCVDLKNRFPCAVRITHPVFFDGETLRQYKKDGRLLDIDSANLDLVALYNPLSNVKKWTPIWVRDREEEYWNIRMFLGVSNNGKVQATTGYFISGATWNFYTLTQPEVSE